jgi:hypothetical protein
MRLLGVKSLDDLTPEHVTMLCRLATSRMVIAESTGSGASGCR